MDSLYVVLVISNLFLSILALVAAAVMYVREQNLKNEWLRVSHEYMQKQNDLHETQEELKAAMSVVQKVHEDRRMDLQPVFDRLAIVETRTSSLSANQRFNK